MTITSEDYNTKFLVHKNLHEVIEKCFLPHYTGSKRELPVEITFKENRVSVRFTLTEAQNGNPPRGVRYSMNIFEDTALDREVVTQKIKDFLWMYQTDLQLPYPLVDNTDLLRDFLDDLLIIAPTVKSFKLTDTELRASYTDENSLLQTYIFQLDDILSPGYLKVLVDTVRPIPERLFPQGGPVGITFTGNPLTSNKLTDHVIKVPTQEEQEKALQDSIRKHIEPIFKDLIGEHKVVNVYPTASEQDIKKAVQRKIDNLRVGERFD